MRKLLIKLKRTVKRLFKVKEDIDYKTARRPRRIFVKSLMGIAAAALITLLYPLRDMRGPLDVPIEGEIAPENIIADFSFDLLKDRSQLEEEQRLIIGSTPLYMDYSGDVAASSRTELRKLIHLADSLAAVRPRLSRDSVSARLYRQYPFISERWLERLSRTASPARMTAVLDTILTDSIYYYGVIRDYSTLPSREYNSIIMKKPQRDLLMIRNQLKDLNGAYEKLLETLSAYPRLSDEQVELYYQIGRYFILPNAAYDRELTTAARDSAVATISPVEKRITSGDLLIRRGTRVDKDKALLLNAYSRELQKTAAERGWFQAAFPILSRFILVVSIIGLLFLFFAHFRPDVFWSNNKLLAVLLIIGLELFLVNFIAIKLVPSIYLYPIAILSILVTVLFDSRLGVLITLMIALLLGILNRFNFSLTLVTALVGSVACFSSGEIRRRSEFYRIVLSLSLAYVVIILVVESLKLSPAGDLLTFCGYGLANALVSPMLAIGILPVFESVFGFCTNITLLELADLNQPLLKRLAIEAPGTYHHAIIVGNLGEAAAKAIGANPLLTRVGAYYHDIGKMEIPEYFVENQLGIKSKHESLNPTMSALVLSSHIKKGRRLGEEAGLPDAVLNFIEEHHGTTQMTYFLNKAREMNLPLDSEDEFRYPGPKPQSRETAIIMLADSTEAASRTLDTPTPARIRNLIQRLINDKFSSGELTQCELTLKDLNDIREAFELILIGVFHHRVAYPKKEVEESR